MSKSIKVFAPATVANVGPGFDIFGLALNDIGDVIDIKLKDTPGILIHPMKGFENLPTDPNENVAGVAIQALLTHLGSDQGFELEITKKVLPGSGLGSSASSAAGAVFGANELLGQPFSRQDLVQFAMEGERASSGVAHADNVSPSLLGGFTFVRSYQPLDVVEVQVPSDLYFTVIHPHIEVKTADSKKILRKEVPMTAAVNQWGNVAGMVAGLITSDYDLIGRSMEDVIVTPVRSLLIPGFAELTHAAKEVGALGCGISGSGPSVFAMSRGESTARTVADSFKACYEPLNINFDIYISAINTKGTHIIDS